MRKEKKMNEANAFLMYYDVIDQFDLLTDEQLGKLMRLIVGHLNGRKTDTDNCDLSVKLMYTMMMKTIERGTERMEEARRRRSEAASAREKKKKAQSATVCDDVPEREEQEPEQEPKPKPEQKHEPEYKPEEKTKIINITEQESERNASASADELSLEEKTPFIIPTAEEVGEYCRKRGNRIDPQRFVDYYNANGWKQGNSFITDWRAAVRVWETREHENRSAPRKKGELTFITPSYNVSEVENRNLAKYRI